MSNHRKPQIIKLLQSTARPCREIPDAVQISRDLTEMPAWLTEDQREMWALALQCVPPKMLKQVDAPTLVTWILAQAAQKRAALAWQQEGLTVMDDKGKAAVNPEFTVFKAASDLIIKASAELGFTPVARSKVRAEPSSKDKPAGFERFREARAG